MPQEEYDEEEDLLNDPSMAVPTRYLAWRSHPAAVKRGFAAITKDVVLANLSEEDLKLLRLHFDLLQQNLAMVKDGIVKMPDVAESNDFLEGQFNMICASSVGYKGYGRSLDTTAIQIKEVRREDVTKKGKTLRGYR